MNENSVIYTRLRDLEVLFLPVFIYLCNTHNDNSDFD